MTVPARDKPCPGVWVGLLCLDLQGLVGYDLPKSKLAFTGEERRLGYDSHPDVEAFSGVSSGFRVAGRLRLLLGILEVQKKAK